MRKLILLLILIVFTFIFPSFSDASSIDGTLAAGPDRAWACGQTVANSVTFSDEPSRFLFWMGGGGSIGADDVAFFYKNGIQFLVVTRCPKIQSPSDIPCERACSGSTNVSWGNYFQDSGANSPDSVTISGTAYETYQLTTKVTDVGFSGFDFSAIWGDCSIGQRVDNGSCIPIIGSITPDKTSCTAPCDVNLTWNTDSYQTAKITKNGVDLTTVNTTNGVSNTNASGGPISDNNLAAGVYDYCLKGNYAHSPDNQPIAVSGNLDCKTVTVLNPNTPTATLFVNGLHDISVGSGDTVNYAWTSTNASPGSGSSTLTISPSSPDPCGNTNSSNWVITGTSGSTSSAIASCQAGYTYTITYSVTGPGGSASDTAIIRVSSTPTPTPIPAESCDYFANPGVPFSCDNNGDGCQGVKYCLTSNVWSECFNDVCPILLQPPNVSFVAVAQPDYCVSGPAAFVSWTYSDPDGNPQSAYQIQVDDEGSAWNAPLTVDTGKVLGSGTSYFTGDGVPPWAWNTTYKVRVRVWDSNDAVSNWTESASWTTPKHAYPIVNFNWSPLNPSARQQIQFSDLTQLFDTSGVGQRGWNWLFGDGSSATNQNPTHSYSNPGTYNITETVTDKDNYTCAITKPIGIEKPIPVWKEVSPK